MATVSSNKSTRAARAIWLVGGTEENFKASKLPSRGEVIKVLFHYHIGQQMNLHDSITKTTEMLLQVWDKARIPTKAPTHVVEHIRKLHAEWQGLKKLINRVSPSNLKNQQMFQESLSYLFDVAHKDAMLLLKIDEDRLFLEAQREKGRRGAMLGIDRNLTQQEERVRKRKAAEEKRAKNVKSAMMDSSEITVADEHSSSSDSSDSTDSDSLVSSELVAGPSTQKSPRLRPRLRGTKGLVTSEVAAALDRTDISDRKAAHIFSAMASTKQLGQDVEELVISRSAIRRARMKHRANFNAEVKASFDPRVPLILHWDGKILEDFTVPGHKRVDRLPVLVSGKNVVKLLSVPKLDNGRAATMAHAILGTLDEWGLRERIKGLCFDTTASNTGAKGGVCIKLESEIGRQLLNLGCRHHVAEIMLEKVFSLHDVSKSPNIEIFGHFKDYWPSINQAAFSTAMDDERTAALVTPWKDIVINVAMDQLSQTQPRDDYRELLELTIIFLGAIPPRGVSFQYPGAVHRARWMARAIYSIKMWLFRTQFPLHQQSRGSRRKSYSKKVWDHIEEVCLFVTAIYIKYWFECPSSTGAPMNDLTLLCELSAYSNRDVAKAAITAFGRHLWYLSEILVGFSFFDDRVAVEEKRLMMVALRENDGSDDPPKRISPFTEPLTKGIHDFVTKSTLKFFKLLDLQEEFMEHDPSEWGELEVYQRNKEVVQSVKVINDLAERGVALIQEFNMSLTRNEEQKQFLLQVVEDHRKTFSAPTKTAAIKRAQPQ
jgi:hypothetical protein